MSSVLYSVFLALFGIYFQVQLYCWEYLVGLCLGILCTFHTNYAFLLFCGLFFQICSNLFRMPVKSSRHPCFCRPKGFFKIKSDSTEFYRCATNLKVAGSIPDGVTGIFH